MQVLSVAQRLMVVFASILLLLAFLLLLHWCFKQIREYRSRQQEEPPNECDIYVIESGIGGSQRNNQVQEVPSFDSVVLKSDGLPSYEEAIAYQKKHDSQRKTMETTC
uniref:Uncharacterized protein n=2 Tax=Lutzomyia longipalpis TaxID=7200 RepID=A0A1B0CQP1_LUTLO